MFQYYVLKDGEEITSYISIENTYVDMAGFIGSTLWLVWLIVVGARFLKMSRQR